MLFWLTVLSLSWNNISARHIHLLLKMTGFSPDRSLAGIFLPSPFTIYNPDYTSPHPLNEQQAEAADCISKCKSGLLGYNINYCKECEHTEILAVSCNNRDCPSRQAPLEKKWGWNVSLNWLKGLPITMSSSRFLMNSTTSYIWTRNFCMIPFFHVHQILWAHSAGIKSICEPLPGLYRYYTRGVNGWISIRISTLPSPAAALPIPETL